MPEIVVKPHKKNIQIIQSSVHGKLKKKTLSTPK